MLLSGNGWDVRFVYEAKTPPADTGEVVVCKLWPSTIACSLWFDYTQVHFEYTLTLALTLTLKLLICCPVRRLLPTSTFALLTRGTITRLAGASKKLQYLPRVENVRRAIRWLILHQAHYTNVSRHSQSIIGPVVPTQFAQLLVAHTQHSACALCRAPESVLDRYVC